MKTNVATYYVVGSGDNEELLRENKFQGLVEEAGKKTPPEPPPQPTKVQSFGLPEAETDADILSLCPSEEIRVSLFNRAASLKMLNDIREQDAEQRELRSAGWRARSNVSHQRANGTAHRVARSEDREIALRLVRRRSRSNHAEDFGEADRSGGVLNATKFVARCFAYAQCAKQFFFKKRTCALRLSHHLSVVRKQSTSKTATLHW